MARVEVDQAGAQAAARWWAQPRHKTALLRHLRYYRDVTLHLVQREFASRHRGSILGWLWSLVPALLQLVVAQFLFTRVIPIGVKDFPVFLLTGILAWNWFAAAVSSATSSLELNRTLVLRPGFPTPLLPIASVLEAMVDYMLALPILLIVVEATVGLSLDAMLLALLIVVELVLAAGVGLLLAPLQIYLRDVARMVALALMIGFWLTPVFYRQSRVPPEFTFVYQVNPMAHLIEAQRQILLYRELPHATSMLATAGLSLVILALGSLVFHALRNSLPDRL